MSGKTVYIKMIAMIQIMAQIGCFVPASSALLRMTDKIFSRIGFQDSIEQNASSFTIELREMEYINSNLTPNSLVIVDELCRSTNPQEGEFICWDFSEKLIKFIGVVDDNYFKPPVENEDEEMSEWLGETKDRNSRSLQLRGASIKLKDIARPFVFLTTHFPVLTKLAEKFNNVINLHMEVEERVVDEKLRLDYKYKIQSGATPVKHYGLALARCLRFPSRLIDRAEEFCNQVQEVSLLNSSKLKNWKTRKTDNSSQSSRSTLNFTTVKTTSDAEEEINLDKEVIDLFSYILLLMSSNPSRQTFYSNTVNTKVQSLIDNMSVDFREMIKTLPTDAIISILNGSSYT